MPSGIIDPRTNQPVRADQPEVVFRSVVIKLFGADPAALVEQTLVPIGRGPNNEILVQPGLDPGTSLLAIAVRGELDELQERVSKLEAENRKCSADET